MAASKEKFRRQLLARCNHLSASFSTAIAALRPSMPITLPPK
jgi:hypothetical protein